MRGEAGSAVVRWFATMMAAAAYFVVATGASAATFTVDRFVGAANDATCTPCLTIQGGIDKAASSAGADIVQVEGGTYTETVEITDGNVVHVRGRGEGTVLVDLDPTSAPSTAALVMHDGRVSAMRIQDAGRAVEMYGGVLEDARVQVTSDPTTESGIMLLPGEGGGQVVRRVVVEVPYADVANYGVNVGTNGVRPLLDGLDVSAGYAIQVTGDAGATVRRSTVRGGYYGIVARDGSATVQSTAVFAAARPGGAVGTALAVLAYTQDASLVARNVTLVGKGSSISRSALALETNNALTGRLTMVDSAVVRWARDLDIWREGPTATTSARISRSMFRPGSVSLLGASPDAPITAGVFTTTTPGFRNLAAEDVRLRARSPLVDRGLAASLGASSIPGLFPRDLRGALRLRKLATNPRRPARVDIGAVEYQPAPRALTSVGLRGGRFPNETLRCIRVEQWIGDLAQRRIRWLRDGRIVPGRTGTTYVIGGNDSGAKIRCQESGISRDGAASTVRSRTVQLPRFIVLEP